MTLRAIFVGPGGLRAGWKFTIFSILAIMGSGGLEWAVVTASGYKPARGWVATDFILSESLSFLAVLGVTALLARLTKRRLREYGFGDARRAPGLWLAGLVWGFAMVAILFLMIMALGGASADGWALHGSELARFAILWAVAMVLLGLFEESLFRGYPLVTLSEGMGIWPAAILLSFLFGAIHYFTKPMESVLDAVNVGLIGLWTCLAFRRTGSLWLVAGFHAAFDFAALVLLGAPNTSNEGKPIATHLLATSFHGPAWLTGGPCGMEASALALPVVGLAFLLLPLLHRGPSGEAATLDA
jgi:membrane protease YdiL (CAAX protease family)